MKNKNDQRTCVRNRPCVDVALYDLAILVHTFEEHRRDLATLVDTFEEHRLFLCSCLHCVSVPAVQYECDARMSEGARRAWNGAVREFETAEMTLHFPPFE